MQPLTIDAIRRHPELLRELQAEARRSRAEHVHRFLAKLLGRRAPNRAPRDRPLGDLRTACCA